MARYLAIWSIIASRSLGFPRRIIVEQLIQVRSSCSQFCSSEAGITIKMGATSPAKLKPASSGWPPLELAYRSRR